MTENMEPHPSVQDGCGGQMGGDEEQARAGDRLMSYLRMLPMKEAQRLEAALNVLKELEASPCKDHGEAVAEAMELLQGRLEGLAGPSPSVPLLPLDRGHMVPEVMDRRPWVTSLGRLVRRMAARLKGSGAKESEHFPEDEPPASREYLNEPWNRAAARRRLFMGMLILAPVLAAAVVMASVLPHKGATILEAAIVIVFAILFAWISVGFWAALFGFVTLLRRYDRFAITTIAGKRPFEVRPDCRTAILFPICNEDVDQIMARVAAIYRSLEQTGRLAEFDFFLLSDTGSPDAWIEEEAAWHRLTETLDAKGRIFYRRRRLNLKRKSGNIAEFCRRCGNKYIYMVVMDADSLMSGATLVRMVEIMERKRHVGILQTSPITIGRETLFARMQQFASSAYGPMFTAGLHFLQLGDAQYWGHNAMIRVKPFMDHCALGKLPGKPPLGGDIMSHDFVEAALMRRAGWGVWLAYDLNGSYEEPAPTLLAELKRDSRWCTGNLQHLRLVFTRGLFPAHRVLFLNGAMSYISSFLWFLFLVLSTTEVVAETFMEPVYFPAPMMLFPEWPVSWHPGGVLSLLGATAVILFLPKLLNWLLHVIKGRSSLFGGPLGMACSILVEIVGSTLIAPIRMLSHSRTVIGVLCGWKVGWGAQQRDDMGTPWLDAVRFHLSAAVIGFVWGIVVLLLNPLFFIWISPVVVSLILAIPVSVFSSRAGMGKLFQRWGVFITPEEKHVPQIQQEYLELAQTAWSRLSCRMTEGGCGFARAVIDPATNALHRAGLRGPRRLSESVRRRRSDLIGKALALGPDALSDREKKELLYDAEAMGRLHHAAWTLPDESLARLWRVPG